jgi:hypothetical protein
MTTKESGMATKESGMTKSGDIWRKESQELTRGHRKKEAVIPAQPGIAFDSRRIRHPGAGRDRT